MCSGNKKGTYISLYKKGTFHHKKGTFAPSLWFLRLWERGLKKRNMIQRGIYIWKRYANFVLKEGSLNQLRPRL
jgi:hypothetical protein